MNARKQLLVGTIVVGMVGVRVARAQDTSHVRPAPFSTWIHDTSQALPTMLARVLGEAAQDVRTGRPVYLVAKLRFPPYVVGYFDTKNGATLVARDSGEGYAAFGPFITPRDTVYDLASQIDSVIVYSHSVRGPARAKVDPHEVDALFLTQAAVDKFMIPFYSQLYGPVFAAGLRVDLSRIMAGGCHKYTRPCIPVPDIPFVPFSDSR
jgi:hypothetical protein